ncbi:MAG: AMP-binding protein [Proteobacteria bacterium]|nr:AMP-binding protein [Pseudomonadota bacterium]
MTLVSWLDGRADLTPDHMAVVCDDVRLSYRALARQVHAAAHHLKHALGVGRGDRVALLAMNRPEYLVLLFACARLGAILTPLNWRLAPPEHRVILADAEPRVLILEPEFAETAALAAAALPDCRQVRLPLALGDAVAMPHDPAVGDDTRLLIVYTSGTTGQPKGAVLTHGALTWNAVNAIAAHDLTGADRVLTTIPMFHVGGLNMQTVPALRVGATVYLHRRFDPAATLAAIRDHRITLTVLVPAQLATLVDHPDWPAADLTSLRLVTTGSSVVPPSLIEPWHARGVTVINIYGATETAPIATALAPSEARRKIGSCGKAALHCAVRVVDDAGRDVAAGVRGEVLVRGPNLLLEYWRRPEATREALVDGWFRSGDVGHVDDDGFLYIDDRKKDVIISGGENVYPAEIEAVLAELPEIAEAAVVPRPHPKWGEVPVAVVVRRADAALTAARVLQAFDGRIARFKHPHAVVFVERLPRTAMGKVQKFKLRKLIDTSLSPPGRGSG